jgi:hypothetical protein
MSPPNALYKPVHVGLLAGSGVMSLSLSVYMARILQIVYLALGALFF